jgi:ribonuclease HI
MDLPSEIPDRAAFGIVLISGHFRKEVSAGYSLTTNNRMELMSVIVALELLKNPGCEVTIYSDSKYVVESVEKRWVFGWVKKGFAGKKNADLWRRFLVIYPSHKVKFIWIKGHANSAENERCDRLAVAAANNKAQHQVDVGYEAAIATEKLL